MEAVLMEAKTMGNYLIYDLVDKEFGTDINGMADYFFGGGNQMLWTADDTDHRDRYGAVCRR